MNSYPHEFLSHPLPLMFVAGILQSPALTTSTPHNGTTRGRTDSVVSDRRLSEAADGKSEVVVGLGILSEQGSAEGTASPTGQSREAGPPSLNTTSPPPPLISPTAAQPSTQPDQQTVPQNPFTTLESNLRQAFSAFSARPNVWKEGVRLDRAPVGDAASAAGSRRGSREEAEREEKGRLFRILVVDKNFRIPSRKSRPATAPPANPSPITTSPDPNLYPAITTTTTHSPLSPLTQGSPTYPDGIMNPSWIRKHEDHVPCVIVLFLRLEADAVDAAPAAAADSDVREKDEQLAAGGTAAPSTTASTGAASPEQSRRERDEALVAEIGERRKKWTDKVPGVKVTVVLLASKEMLADDLDDFVQSLQQAVFPHAMDFYAARYRANRRKRAKLPANPQAVPYPATAPHGVRPLGTQGWAARYDWKAGYWAEGRGDVDLARRHYEDAWQALCYIFGLKDALPPRTKRWLEAKVLADCIAIKASPFTRIAPERKPADPHFLSGAVWTAQICRLAFYRNDSAAALTFFHQHLSKFGDFSVAWGIGKNSFEFWSWLSRQYRLFAELLEIVVAHGLVIHAPLPVYAVPPASIAGGINTTEEVLVSAVKPLLVLQNPGYYYYTAGNCAVQRKMMFEKAIEGDVLMTSVSSTAMSNEKKVDHTGIIVELYTKAYELLQARPGKNRLALYIAYRIAEIQSQGGHYDLAMTFLRKIAHVYEEERWNPIVWSIRSLWYNCAQRTGSVDDAARLLLEMMAPYGSQPPEDPRQYQDDLDVLLKTTAPSTTEPIKVVQPSANALIKIQVGFLQSESIVNVGTTFIVELYASADVQFEELEFSSVHITFSNRKTCEIKHISSAAPSDRVLDLGEVGSEVSQREANLLFRPGDVKRFCGTIKSGDLGPLAITEAALILSRNSWTLHLVNKKSASDAPVYLDEIDAELSSDTRVIPRPLKLDLQLQHDTKAFLSETIFVNITATSTEEKEFTLFYEVEAEEADSGVLTTVSLSVEVPADSSQTGRDRLSRQEFGIIPAGASAMKEVTLKYHDLGEQQIRITFFAILPDDPNDKVNTTSSVLSTISISVPFVGDNDIRFEPSPKPPAPMLSSKRLEQDFFDEICKASFYTKIYQKTPIDLTIHNIEYTHLTQANFPTNGNQEWSLAYTTDMT
ncbi:hypothetical protein QFC21_005327 [Naganishia friedmannii]|uniref:Uncharacterized protein n=1 Tax=Naganishia friedmannii TaxID=89922 RepID=A0ACC2V9D3_9TREE|nr:hypothetical protein QFC21_005327 [Naganishia friedmannii]